MADDFGIGRRTFYDMMQRDAEIAVRYKRGKAKAIRVIAQGLITKARAGDTTSMIFILKTQAGWRETSRIEHGLPDDAPQMPETASQQVARALDVIAARHAARDEIAGAPPASVRIGHDKTAEGLPCHSHA